MSDSESVVAPAPVRAPKKEKKAASPYSIKIVPNTRLFKVWRAGKPYSISGVQWDAARKQKRAAEKAEGLKPSRTQHAPPVKYFKTGVVAPDLLEAAVDFLSVKGMTRVRVARELLTHFPITPDMAHVAAAAAMRERARARAAGEPLPSAKPKPKKYVEAEAEEGDDSGSQAEEARDDEESEEEAPPPPPTKKAKKPVAPAAAPPPTKKAKKAAAPPPEAAIEVSDSDDAPAPASQ